MKIALKETNLSKADDNNQIYKASFTSTQPIFKLQSDEM